MIKRNFKKDPLTLGSFCSGGGIDLTASKFLGLETVLIAEINKFASETYKLNHKREIPYQVEDVKHCSQADYSQAISTYTGNILNHPTLSQNDVDMLKINLEHIFIAKSTHSCKDITTGNPNRDTTSERSQAIYRILDFVEDGQPDYVLIENVPAFSSAKDHKGRPYLDETLKRLKSAKYNVMQDTRPHVLNHQNPKAVRYKFNTKNDGEIQDRYRLNIFASKDPLPAPPLPEIQPRVNFGDVFKIINQHKYTGDSRAYDRTLDRLVGQPIDQWFRGAPKGLNTWCILDPTGLGQTKCVMWLDKWYMWIKTKFFKPEFIKNGKLVKAIDDDGNQAFRRISLPESLACFSANPNIKWPTQTLYDPIDKKFQRITKKMKQLIIGQGYCNLQFYHMVKSIIPKPKLRAFEQAYVKKSPLIYKFLGSEQITSSASS